MKLCIIVCVVPLVFVTLIGCGPKITRPNVEDLVRQSRIIFTGTVKKLNATTMPVVPATDSTAIVNIDEILLASEAIGDFTGQEITVQLSKPQSVEVEQQLVFFTNAWLYGKSMAVTEVGSIEAGEDTIGLRKDIADALLKLADQALQRRITLAELIIVGKVSRVASASEQVQRAPITEHAPGWWEALIQVESVEKGRLSDDNAVILFPNSTDEMWIDSPKFRVGQEGIWILQKDQQEKGMPILRLPGYTALDPLDLQPKDQLERIRRLIKGIQ